MATSIVARSMATFLSVVLLMGSGMLAVAQSVQPSNGSLPFPERTSLKIAGGPLFDSKSFTIAPLTAENGGGAGPVAVANNVYKGQFTLVDYMSVGNLTGTDIAFINCDPNGSNIAPSSTVATAGDRKPRAIVLYSLQLNECLISGAYGYTTLYSMVSLSQSQELMNTAALYPQSVGLFANIGVVNGTGPPSSGNPADSNNPQGPAPTTAVAMSILYSITGIITLLFLVIIATGAIRAHRHPERYGPRNGLSGGRARQSRAKGLARAMLETLPIVKFGDPEPVKPGVGDIELADGHGTTRDATTNAVTAAAFTATAKDGSKVEENAADTTHAYAAAGGSGLGAAQAESVKSAEENAPKEGDLGCSICTEDFTTGEDVRVLPCHHKYHPACIDPWLLNVSGTCPLCRHDLNPVKININGQPSTEGGELPPPLSADADDRLSSEDGSPQRRRMSRFLDLNRLRHAPADERIAALRQYREESQRTGENPEDTEEPSRRARLTNRLRDTFRVRTRAQNDTTP